LESESQKRETLLKFTAGIIIPGVAAGQMKSFIVALLAAAALSGGVLLSMVSAESGPAAPQTLVLKTIQIDVSQPPKPGHRKAPIPFNRHFADPTSLGQVKQ
jgi:hypothetical protein